MLAKEMFKISQNVNEPTIPDAILSMIKVSAESGNYSVRVINLKDNHIIGLRKEGFEVKKVLWLDNEDGTRYFDISWKL